ncbi:MAG: hypothetical protein NZ700_01270 [Gemmataceae bacterium]|nr:hypothetical protein [Gemmataceae bacterium]MDW8265644.1 hypothetical protein [Gemmataceae bacterium]
MGPLFAHHAKSWLGVEIEINGQTWPDGMFDHALLAVATVLMLYGAVAVIRDCLRWFGRQRPELAVGLTGPSGSGPGPETSPR